MAYKPVGADENGNFPPRVVTKLNSTYAPVTGSSAYASLNSLFKGADLWTFGHSFVDGVSDGGTSTFYRNVLASTLGLTHPTAADSTNLEHAVGGSRVEEMAQRLVGTDPFPNGRRGVALIQAFMNTARLHGVDTLAIRSAKNCLRTMLAVLSASSRVENDAAAFTWSGTWSTVTSTQSSGGGHRSTTSQFSYADVTLPSKGNSTGAYHLMTYGRTGVGPIVEVKNVTTSTVLATVDLSNQVYAGDSPVSTNYVIPVNAKSGEVIRFTKIDSGAGSFSIDGLLVPDNNPFPIIGVKEPYLLDYSASTAFPNGSDAAIDAFNAIWDQLAAEYDAVVVADPNAAGYWNKNTDIGADEVHPNVLGNQHLAQAAIDAILSGSLKRATGITATGKTPTVDNLFVIPTYSVDTFTRADGAIGSTETGAYAWTAQPAADQSKYVVGSNRLAQAPNTRANPGNLAINDGQANGVLKLTLVSAGTVGGGLMFRGNADGSNGYVFDRDSTGVYRIRQRTAIGTISAVAGPTAAIGAANDQLEVVLNGSSISAKVNGVEVLTYTDTLYTTNTYHGYWALPAATGSSADTWSHTGLPA